MRTVASLNRHQLAEIGGLLAEPARAAILLELIDGSARPAGELALLAGVAPATASAHLRKLCDGGLLEVLAQGRYRYYRIAGEEAAQLVETVATVRGRTASTGIVASANVALARARTCYRHLAGRLGVALFDNLRKRRGLELTADAVRLNPRGLGVLERAGLLSREDEAARLPGRGCLDWTERRYHLAGALGTHLTQRMFEAGWLRRRREARALIVTPRGQTGFAELGIEQM